MINNTAGPPGRPPRIRWEPVVERAAAIVDAYATGDHPTRVTLRQLFYRLLSEPEPYRLPNTHDAYKRLSSLTAAARRAGTFPALLDDTRRVVVNATWDGPGHALRDAADRYALDRTAGQEWQVWLGVEKATLVRQVRSWFGETLGVPVVALRGYGSQTYLDDIRAAVEADGRPAVLIYAGDLDPSGEDIDRDFVARTDCWKTTERIAVSDADVSRFDLTPQPGKAADSRAAAFRARHGGLYQVEVEAMDPADLRGAFGYALDGYWAADVYDGVLAREDRDRDRLRALVDASTSSDGTDGR